LTDAFVRWKAENTKQNAIIWHLVGQTAYLAWRPFWGDDFLHFDFLTVWQGETLVLTFNGCNNRCA